MKVKESNVNSGIKDVTINITGVDNVSSIDPETVTSKNDGKFDEVTIVPTKNTGEFKIKITEEDPPAPYLNFGEITLTVKYDKSKQKGEDADVTEVTEEGGTGITVFNSATKLLKIKNEEDDPNAITIKLKKTDSDTGSELKGASFIIAAGDNVKKVTPNTVQSDIGGITITIVPKDVTKNTVKISITEVTPPSGYTGAGSSTLTITYDQASHTVTGISATGSGKVTGADEITFENKKTDGPDLGLKLKMHKCSVDEEGEPAAGAKFSALIHYVPNSSYDPDNRVSISDHSSTATTNSAGDLSFDLSWIPSNFKAKIPATPGTPEVTDPDTGEVITPATPGTPEKPAVTQLEFEITLTETQAPKSPNPKYYALKEPIVLKMIATKNGSSATFDISVVSGGDQSAPNGDPLTVDITKNSGKVVEIKVPEKKCSVDLDLQKLDELMTRANGVDNTTFKVTWSGVESLKYNGSKKTSPGFEITTDTNGQIKLREITPSSEGNFSITLEEVEDKTPEGLVPLKPITITWSGSDLSLVSVETEDENGAKTLEYEYDSHYDSRKRLMEFTAVDENKIEKYVFKKVDKVTGEGLEDFTFTLSFEGIKSIGKLNGSELSEGTVLIPNVQTDENGEIVLEDIILEKQDIQLTIMEQELNPKFTKEDHEANDEKERYYYELIEKPIIFDINYKGFGSNYKITTKLNNGGEEVKQGNEDYYGLRKLSDLAYGENEKAIVKNIPLMDLKGQVWVDDQKGNKAAEPPNGVKDDGRFMPGVEAWLNESKSGSVKPMIAKKDGKEVIFITTGSPDTPPDGIDKFSSTNVDAGKYKFEEIECPRADFSGTKDIEIEGYVVKFEYNGIEYEDTIEGGDSSAFEYYGDDEFARDNLNARHKTITKNASNTTTLGYDETVEESITRADLQDDISGKNPNGGEDDFSVRSKTELLTVTDTELDFGMVKRFFDLKIDMIINSATLTINGKQTAYSYDEDIKWLNETEKDNLSLDPKDQEVEKTKNYNDKNEFIDLKLYDSDFRYRIQDYNLRLENTDSLLNGEQKLRQMEDPSTGKLDNPDREEVKKDNDRPERLDDELRVFVTYEVAIMNQSYEQAQVNELTYYYDPAYELVAVGNTQDYTMTTDPDTGKEVREGSGIAIDNPDIAKADGGTVGDYKVVKVSGPGIEKRDELSDGDYRQVLYFTFEIKRDLNNTVDTNGDGKADWHEGLPSEIKENGDEGKSFATIVEISSYSTWDKDKNDTEGGFIDEDSNPGNCPGQDPWEDDTYGAKALKVTICEEVRKLEGIVWDDTYQGDTLNYDKDGRVDPEDALDGVIVQLVEIRNIPDASGSNTYREAIWQQTMSGTNEVATRNNRTGYTNYQESYTTDVTGTGKYKFEDFIPGDYIVRFIYGDGLNCYYGFMDDDDLYTDEIEEKHIKGTLLDLKELDNVSNDVEALIKKYNGQDYQTTKDARSDYQYNKQYYEDKQNKENYTSAWDNEPRRLQVMAYSTTIDGELGSALDTLPKIIDGYSEEMTRRAQLLQIGYTKENQLLMDYFNTIFVRESNFHESFYNVIREELEFYIYETTGMTLDEYINSFIDYIADLQEKSKKDNVDYIQELIEELEEDPEGGGILGILLLQLKDEDLSVPDSTRTQRVYNSLFNMVLQQSAVYENMVKLIHGYVSEKTWMCADTSIIPINVSEMNKNKANTTGETTVETETVTPDIVYDKTAIEYFNVNCGLMLRPITKLELEKHITQLRIVPAGTGISPIVDARAEISDIIKPNTSSVTTAGVDKKLKVIRSFRDNRGPGFWNIETDVEELTESADLSVDYTYVIRNESEEDYLTKGLNDEYKSNTGNNIDSLSGTDDYMRKLKNRSYTLKKQIRNDGYNKEIGVNNLGGWYYTRKVDTSKESPVVSRVEDLYDYLNNTLNFVDDNTKATYSGIEFEDVNKAVGHKYVSTNRIIYKESGQVNTNITLNTVIHNHNTLEPKKSPFNFLVRNVNDLTDNNRYKKNGDSKNPTPVDTDFTKKVTLTRTLDVKELQDNGGITIPTYLSEIAVFSNAAGRRNMECTNENLDYVHSEDNEMVLDAYAYQDSGEIKYGLESEVPDLKQATQLTEKDEYWGERILITKPTGGDRQRVITIIIVAVSSLVVLGVGIVLIKKYALKKQ